MAGSCHHNPRRGGSGALWRHSGDGASQTQLGTAQHVIIVTGDANQHGKFDAPWLKVPMKKS